jgi:hypothetical protein
MSSGMNTIKMQYITESELSELLNVDTKRIRDLRSNHVQGKQEFIDHIKPTSKSVLYRLQDVFKYLENQKVHSFGKDNIE